jgi:drug/metabolite transporter (DMT)-like permease
VIAVRTRSNAVAYASFTAICVIWGTTFLAIRVALDTMPSLYLTGLRFVSAGVLLLVIALGRGERLPRRAAQWRHEAITGVIMFAIANASLVWSEHYISSGLAALLVATIPLWMAAIDAMFLRNEILSSRRIVGLLIGFCGVGLLVLPGFTAPDRREFLLGVLGTQISAIAWSIGTVRSKYRPSGVSGAMGPSLQMLLGGVVVSIVALVATPLAALSFTPRTVAALAYLSIFGSVIGYTAYQIALKTIAPGRVALYAYVNPAVAVVAGALVLHEVVTWRMIAAMVVILSGVTLARGRNAAHVTPLTQPAEERAA